MKKFPQEEDLKYKRIYGAVSPPSAAAAGFAVVIGETRELGFQGKPKYVFLDEIQEWDGRELIERVGWLDYRYRPELWFGNTRDASLDKFTYEFNQELTVSGAVKGRRQIKLVLPGLLLGKVEDKPFATIVPDLNRLLGGSDRNIAKQRLFLKEGSKLMTRMKAPGLGEMAEMTFDDFPAVSALAFAVMELEETRDRKPQSIETDNEYDRY